MQAHSLPKATCSVKQQQHKQARPLAGAARSVRRARTVQCQASSSRRDVLLAQTAAAALLAAGQQVLPAWADDGVEVSQVEVATSTSSSAAGGGKQVFFDCKVEGEPVGRIVIRLLDDVKVGSQRFADLAEGKEGVGFRLSKFDGIYPTYIRNEGVKSLSYNAAGRSSIAGGDSVQALEEELSASSRKHDAPGLVSIVVREATERPVKERLVAMRGKLVTLKEQAGEAPNGSAFMITTGPTPELDATNLIVGQVVGGFDVVQKLSALPFAKPRDSYYDAPFFQAGKMMGDKRATVAEKRFNRPLKRVLIADAGVL